MIWKNEYSDCKLDFRECEKLVNEYMNLLYKRGYEPVFFYDEHICGPTYGIKVNINGYDLTMYFDYLETDEECGPDLDYYIKFPLNGLTEDFMESLNVKYEKELDDCAFENLYMYDENEIAEIIENHKNYAEEDGETYEAIDDIEPCITLSCGYMKQGRKTTLNLEKIINALTEKDGVVEKIKKEIESGGVDK